MTTINQREYLKKYLSSGDESGKKKKRKKKKGTAISDRMKIIDDDVDAAIFNKAVEEDLYSEDAPQIVGVIDERPLELRIDDYRKSDLWKPVGTQNAIASQNSGRMNEAVTHGNNKQQQNIDVSPPRRYRSLSADRSPPRRNKANNSNTPPRRRGFSPSKNHLQDKSPSSERSLMYSRKFEDHDPSPPRRRKDGDSSIKYQRRDDSNSRRSRNDLSPPIRRRDNDSSVRPEKRDDSGSSRYRNDDSRYRGRNKDHDSSPPRKRRETDESRKYQTKNYNLSPDGRKKEYDKISSQRKHKSDANDRRKHADLSPPRKKTLDGKTAGLQNADELARETEVWKKREDELFKNMSAEVSGRNAVAIVRDRKTGKIRDFKKEAEEESKRKEKEAENQEKYARWGKGLKQVEDHNEKVSNELYEMSKPLARYADDEDLEKYLKEQEREGDPMLDYIRKKKKKKQIVEQIPLKPQYEGEFMPNRYGIRPGYRWDGVDRSNGYEKKWFEVLNSRKAQQEEVYKWSTEDM